MTTIQRRQELTNAQWAQYSGEISRTERLQQRRAPGLSAIPSLTARSGTGTNALGKRMDAFFAKMEGPYRVGGKSVRVTPAFVTNYGGGADAAKALGAIKRALGDKVFADVAMSAARATSTRGTPEDVRRATQALIDAGKLPKNVPPELGIRGLMKSFHIGTDCRGYVYHAFLYSRGTGNLSADPSRYFTRSAADVLFTGEPKLRSVPLDQARIGDILRLKPDADGRDHNVLIRSNRLVSFDSAKPAAVHGREVPRDFLRGGSSVRVMELDSSWGDSGDFKLGGPARRVWLHNEATDTWGYWDNQGEFQSSDKPYNHELEGIYRPRSEP